MEQNDTETRFKVLEVKISYLEDFMGRLQEQVVAQGSVLDRLANENTALKEKVISLVSEREELPNRKPPHY